MWVPITADAWERHCALNSGEGSAPFWVRGPRQTPKAKVNAPSACQAAALSACGTLS